MSLPRESFNSFQGNRAQRSELAPLVVRDQRRSPGFGPEARFLSKDPTLPESLRIDTEELLIQKLETIQEIVTQVE